MRCTVVYALPDRQWCWQVELPATACVEDALQRACAMASSDGAAEIDWQGAKIGIFGRLSARTERLTDGDRVEIYRPLAADPKESRRDRARRLRRR